MTKQTTERICHLIKAIQVYFADTNDEMLIPRYQMYERRKTIHNECTEIIKLLEFKFKDITPKEEVMSG